jgi:hypothetical protein
LVGLFFFIFDDKAIYLRRFCFYHDGRIILGDINKTKVMTKLSLYIDRRRCFKNSALPEEEISMLVQQKKTKSHWCKQHSSCSAIHSYGILLLLALNMKDLKEFQYSRVALVADATAVTLLYASEDL